MSIVTRENYNSLIELRQTLQAELDKAIADLAEAQSRLTDEEAFLAGFDATQALLEASNQQLTTANETLEAQKVANGELIDSKKETIEELNKENEGYQDAANEAAAAGDSVEEARLLALIAANDVTISALAGEVATLTAQVESDDQSIKANTQLIADQTAQISDNVNRKQDLDNGGLQSLIDDVTANTAGKNTSQTALDDFNTANGATIALYQAQQVTRDENIKTIPNSLIDGSKPSNADVLKTESDAVKDAINAILGTKITESGTVNDAIENAKSNAGNSFLNAADAYTLTMSGIYSFSGIMGAIQRAARNGLFEISYPEMPITLAHALIKEGYFLRLSTELGESSVVDVIINWQGLERE